MHQKQLPLPPSNTSLGALAHYCIYAEAKYFSPMNIHWGLFSDLTPENLDEFSENPEALKARRKLDKSVKRDLMATRAEFLFEQWLNALEV